MSKQREIDVLYAGEDGEILWVSADHSASEAASAMTKRLTDDGWPPDAPLQEGDLYQIAVRDMTPAEIEQWDLEGVGGEIECPDDHEDVTVRYWVWRD